MLSEMLSKRGTELRVMNGYKFRMHKYLANEVERWVCTRKTCKTFFKSDVRGTMIEDNSDDHNHLPDSRQMLMRQSVSNACKRQAKEDLFKRPSKVMRREITADALSVLTEADMTQVRKAIHSARAKERPPLPKTLDDLHIILHEYDVKTKVGERF